MSFNIIHVLEKKVGKKHTNQILCTIFFVFGAWWFYTYFFLMKPLEISDLHEKIVNIESAEYLSRKHEDEVLLMIDGKKFWLGERYWQGLYTDEMIVNLLNNKKNVRIWLEDAYSTSVIGVQSSNIFLSPEAGVKKESQFDNVILALGILHSTVSLYYLKIRRNR